jgi:hypothetical protein
MKLTHILSTKQVNEGVAESMPMEDAVKVLRQYGADHFKTGSETLYFYKNGQPFNVDLIMNDDATRSVSISQLNSATRRLKGQGVEEGVLDDTRARMAARRNPVAPAPAAQPVAPAPVAADDGYKVGDIVDFGVGVPKPKVIQQGTITAIRRTPHGMMVYTVKTADGQTHELDTMMRSLYMMPTQAASTVAEADTEFDASKIDPNAKCKTCGTAFKNHFRFDDNGKITGTLVRHMTMKDDFPGMPGRDASAFFGTKPGMISRPTSGTSNLARPNPTPDLPRATKISQNKTTGETVISYKGKVFALPDSPYAKAPEGVTGERVLVPAAAFGIRAMGDVIAILGNDGKAYAEQPMKVFNTYSTAKSQGVAEGSDDVASATPAKNERGRFTAWDDDEPMRLKCEDGEFRTIQEINMLRQKIGMKPFSIKSQQGVAEGSGPKEKQKTPYRDINSPEYRAAADKQKQRMDKDKAAEPGKKMLSKQGVTEDEEVRLGGMTRAERESRFRSRKQDLLQDYALLGKLTTDIIRAINNEVFLTKEQIIDFYKQQIEDPDLTALEYAHDNNIPSSGLLKGVLRYLAQRGFSMLDIRKLMGKAAEQKKKDTLALPPPGPNEGVMEDAYRYGAGGEWDKRNMKAKNPEIERDLKAFKVWINGGPSTSLGPGGLTSIIDGVQTYFERINPTDDAAVAIILQSIFKSTIGQLRTIKPPPMWAQYLNPVLDAAIKEPMNQGTPAAPAARTAPALGEPPAAPAAPGGAPAAPAAPAAKKFNTANATDVTPRSVTPVAPPRMAAPMMRLRERDIEEGRDDRGFFNNVEQWHEAKSDIEHDDQWETSKFIVVKNNGKTVAKWSKADNYGWVDSSQQEVAEVNEDVAAINAQRDRAINHVAAARELAEARRMTPKQTAKPQTIVTETAQPVMAPKAVVSRSLNSLLKSAGLKQK